MGGGFESSRLRLPPCARQAPRGGPATLLATPGARSLSAPDCALAQHRPRSSFPKDIWCSDVVCRLRPAARYHSSETDRPILTTRLSASGLARSHQQRPSHRSTAKSSLTIGSPRSSARVMVCHRFTDRLGNSSRPGSYQKMVAYRIESSIIDRRKGCSRPSHLTAVLSYSALPGIVRWCRPLLEGAVALYCRALLHICSLHPEHYEDVVEGT